MKNKLLYITRQSIPYIKELRPIAGSVTACILWQQLDFYFVKKPNGFYKFLEPCDHPAYRLGDSWVEELGFSVKEFRNAFDKIGIRYSSKNRFNNTNDKFRLSNGNETLFCSYHDKTKGLTFYFRNHDYVDQLLDNLVKNSKSLTQPIEKSTDAQRAFTELPKGNLRNYPKGIYGDAQRESTLTTEKTTEKTTKKISEKNTHADLDRSGENFHKKNVCVLDELNDSEKAAWQWAQKHNFWKGRITTVRQLRTNLAKGRAFRVQFEQAHPAVKPVNGKEAKRVWKKMKIDDCPYCDKRGVIDMRDLDGDHFEMDRCPHNHEVVKELAIKKKKMVFSAKPGYEDPAGLKALEKKRAEKAREHAKKAKDCPYCNERGVINMCDPDNDRFIMDLCPHDPEIIKKMAIEKKKIIKSAKPGYEDPAGLKKPKITPAEKARTREKVERMIGGFQPN